MYGMIREKTTAAINVGAASLYHLSILAAFSALSCFGQAGRGGISGTVTDTSKALVAGATIELRDIATGTERTLTTGSTGLYSFSALVPGNYDLNVQHPGFDSSLNQGIVVEVDRVVTLDIVLSPGHLAQTINVSATQTPLLDTSDSTVSTVINNKTIEGVPLQGRNLFLLVQLGASVTPANGALNSTGAISRPGIGVSAFRVNGLPEGSLAYILDGSPLTIVGYGTSATSPAFTPALDSIQEFRLETNNSSATAPGVGSGVMSLVSKSGSDLFHGSAFYFERPDSLVANDPFNKAAQLQAREPNTPPGFERKQGGGSAGGPIKRGKLFFFGDYERIRSASVQTETTTVPTQAERTGDMSDVPTIYNPFQVDASGHRVAFANNFIPPSMQDPVAVNMEKFLPLPNSAGQGAYHINNYFDASPYPGNADTFDVRLDDYLNSKQTVFGRYSFADVTSGSPDHFHNGADPQFRTNYTRGQNVLLAYNDVINPTTLLQVRYSFLRHAEHAPLPSALQGKVNLTELGFPASLAAEQFYQSLPDIFISGQSGVGSRANAIGFKFAAMNHDVIVSLEKTFGRHDVKIGFEFRKDLENLGQPNAPSGSYTFDSTATSSATYSNNG